MKFPREGRASTSRSALSPPKSKVNTMDKIHRISQEEFEKDPSQFTKIPADIWTLGLSFGVAGVIATLLVEDGTVWRDVKHLQTKAARMPKGRSGTMQEYLREIASCKYAYLLDKIGNRKASSSVSKQAREMMLKAAESTCEWCNEPCHRIIEHHYPIPHRDGGHETVKICGRCHDDFHHFENILSTKKGIHRNQR